MIFDLAKDLYLIFISGFISLSFFRFRRRKSYTKINGEKYVMILLAYGVLSYFSYLSTLTIIKAIGVTPPVGAELKTLLTLVFFSIAGVFWGYLFSKSCFLKIFDEETSLLREEGVGPETSGLVEIDFVETIKPEPRHEIYIFDLSSRKVYVGFLLRADIDDNMPTEEKVVKIVPLKSGYRSSESLEIS